MSVRTRMAPSPTGDIHAGSMATVLKNYAWAKRNQGKFILRIEDTDQVREVAGAVSQIQQVIKDYGLDWDEGPEKGGEYGPYIQSQRTDIYRQHAQILVDNGNAYPCFCSKERLEQVRKKQQAAHQPPRYDRHCLDLSAEEVAKRLESGEPHVIRLKVPNHQEISFDDLIRGKISFNTNQVDDQVLIKSDGFPTYHLAVVVDDHLMKISLVMRGEEWISSTPKHLLLYRAFGWQPPTYAHIPLFLNPDGKGKMSKRKGTVSARSFLEQGYLPEAMLNFFMILGWTPQDQREVLSLAEYIQEFDPADLNPNSVVFDLKKLNWLNGIYIRKLSLGELTRKLKPFTPNDCPEEMIPKIVPLVSERLVKLNEFEQLTYFFYRPIHPDRKELLRGADQALVESQLKLTITALASLDIWNEAELEALLGELQEAHNWQRKQYLMMLRSATMAEKYTPPLFASLAVFSQEEVINRLNSALSILH